MNLDDSAIAQYHDQGFCITDQLLDAGECEEIVDAFNQIQDRLMLGSDEDGALRYQPMLFDRSETLTGYIVDPRILEIMAELIGPNVRMYWEQLVAKPPQARTELPWHQDDGYAPTDPPGYVTCWLALDDADTSNGCIWVIPESHRDGIYPHRMDGPNFRNGIDGFAGDTRGIPVPIRKGQALLFNSLLFHRSGPNTSDTNRRAWIIQYCDAAARHGNSLEELDDRTWVIQAGKFLTKPYSERPMDVGKVFANWTPV